MKQSQQIQNTKKSNYRTYIVPAIALLLLVVFAVVAVYRSAKDIQTAFADGNYVIYTVADAEVIYTSITASEEVFNPEYGAVYSYDDSRYVYDPDLGKDYDITANSLNYLVDPVIAQAEYSRYIATQTANGFTVDTLNFTYISMTGDLA